MSLPGEQLVSDSDAPEAERNMAAGEGLSHSSLIKTTSPAVSSNTELSPDVDQELWSSDQGQEGFPDGVYLLASVIFQNDHLERPAEGCKVNYVKDRELPLPEVKGEEMQQAAYQLAFDTLKYQELLEDIMTDCFFHPDQPLLLESDERMNLLAVFLYDFQDRKFNARELQGQQEVIPEVRDMEEFLLRFKTRVAASLARCRIKNNLISIDYFLPENLKEMDRRSRRLPLYAWVNTLKTSLDEVQDVLKDAGFSQVESVDQLEGRTFCQDPHCEDTLVFPAQAKAELRSTNLAREHKLIIQDKFCSVSPNAVSSLLLEKGDVLMVGSFSGLTICHTAALIADKQSGGGSGRSRPTVYVCVGDRTDAQREALQETTAALGCKNVKLLPEEFRALGARDKRFQNVRVILLIPKCSVSAISNPVGFLLQENGAIDLLQNLSRGFISQSKLEALVTQQKKDIDTALKFPQVGSVVYSTCSLYPMENEEVVTRAVKQAKEKADKHSRAALTKFRLCPSPFSSTDHAADSEKRNFFMLEPSEESNGCFLAVLGRVPEPVAKESPKDVIKRANAKGILDRIGTRKELSSRSSAPSTAADQSKNHRWRSRPPPCNLLNRQLSAQDKSRPWSSASSSCSSMSRPNSSSSFLSFASSNPPHAPSDKGIRIIFNSPSETSPATSASHLSTKKPSGVNHRRHYAEKPMLLELPFAQFDAYFPPQYSRVGFRPVVRKRGQTPFLSRSMAAKDS
ncbi:putative methyltransferase NSUN7 isoform X2 [Nelusetta ayraudi]|uniref:putative methyltransferase NSUN7 isoform X2 n=1 Tax=Nelusetta ayraudi TaxID=303726 RepID=UPI003F70F465